MSPISVGGGDPGHPLSHLHMEHTSAPLSSIEEGLGRVTSPGTPSHSRNNNNNIINDSLAGTGARRKTSTSQTIRSAESKRSSFCSDLGEGISGRWSPEGELNATERPDYVPIDFSGGQPTVLGGHTGMPIPVSATSAAASALRGMSPASSSSLISGTPNSTESRFPPEFSLGQNHGLPPGMIPNTQDLVMPTKSISYLRDDDDDEDEVVSKEAGVEDKQQQNLPLRAYSISGGSSAGKMAKPRSRTTSMTGRSSNTSMDIPSSRKMSASPFGKTPPVTQSAVPSGQSPNFFSRFDSFFRSRTNSVPSKPPFAQRRRHRTQSEGEKDVGNAPGAGEVKEKPGRS